jgi:glycerol-3-phosphate dehydrogenase
MTNPLPCDPFDLIIIGGGINGAGIARDAALRGLKTLLLDKGDFCGGATSWSTRLVHGGLRYLEYFEVGLVRESLREREILLKIAPHLVKPLLLTIPIYRRRPASPDHRPRPFWKIQAGMRLYDWLSYDKSLPGHRMLSRSVFRQLFRCLDAERLVGGAQYYDAQVAYAERLALENILDATAAGATVHSYWEVTALHRVGDRIESLTCCDRISQQEFQVKVAANGLIVNTAGAWVDEVLHRGQRNGQPAAIGNQPKIGPTKGSHIVVDRFVGAPEEGGFYTEAKSDGRPFFILPWLGKVLIGTTDLHYNGSLESIKATDAEIDYLLRETNLMIPVAQLRRADVRFTYSGVRPLPYAVGKRPGSITRSHLLFDHTPEGASNLRSLIGGKITTYRQVGDEVVQLVFARQKRSAPPCPTAQKSLPGAIAPEDPRIATWLDQYGTDQSVAGRLPRAIAQNLIELYGARAEAIFALVAARPELGEPLGSSGNVIAAQVLFAVESEYAQTLVDILLRRLMISIRGDYGFEILPQVTEILARDAGWSSDRCEHQVADYRAYMRTHCIPDYQ